VGCCPWGSGLFVGWLTEGRAAMPIDTAVEVVIAEDPIEGREMRAVAGFLAGYGGSTRVSYAADLRLFAAWCHEAKPTCISSAEPTWSCMDDGWRRRPGCARRWRGRLSTLASFYRYAEQDDLVDLNPAVMSEGRRLFTARAPWPGRNELAAFLVRPAADRPVTTPWRRCWRSTGCGSPRGPGHRC
jgi:hypothetical protein